MQSDSPPQPIVPSNPHSQPLPPSPPKPLSGMQITIIGCILVIIGFILLWVTNLQKIGCGRDPAGFATLMFYSIVPFLLTILLIGFAARELTTLSLIFSSICLMLIVFMRFFLWFLWSSTLCRPYIEIGGIGYFLILFGSLLSIAGAVFESWKGIK